MDNCVKRHIIVFLFAENNMEDLIKALRIFEKYCDDYHRKFPFCCDHDIIIMNGAGKNDVSSEDLVELQKLGWEPYEDFGFCSFRYGSN